jgi:bis(5'-nucleosidyl)-tetraphosphatase
MLEEHSAGAIIFKKEKDELLFLLLHYEEGHWGAAKGHVEKGENLEQTALREIREETGLTDIRLITGFQVENRYVYQKNGQLSNKTVDFFLAEALKGVIKLSFEHVAFAWLPFTEALAKVTFKSEKEVWQAAQDFLKKMALK